MIYMLDIITAIFVMATGFATSWVGVELVRLAGWRAPAAGGMGGSPLRIGSQMALVAMIGPRLLLVSGFENWRRGRVSAGLFALLVLVAGGWSMCAGVLVLQLAFASGYFLA